MNSPIKILQDKILIPLYNFQKENLSRSTLFKVCNGFGNFIADKSSDMPFILLFGNALSIISSHWAQIRGLKKSDRKNKDYLITQEYKEFGLDMLFTIIPPFLLKNFLEKKLYSGQWTTKSARQNLLDVVAVGAGASKEDLYNITNKPLKEIIGNWTAQLTNYLKKIHNLPQSVKKIINFIEKNPNVRLPDPNQIIPKASLNQVCIDCDTKAKDLCKNFYNGSAYDEIIGQIEGIIIIATLLYTILSSSIITPILKNKLSNKAYDKKMENAKKTELNIFNAESNNSFDLYSHDRKSVFFDINEISNSKKINSDYVMTKKYSTSSLKI